MNLNIGKEVAAMKRMTVNELRAKYAEVFGEETEGPAQGVADAADRLADAGAGRGRSVGTGPPTGRRTGQRRRPADHGPQGAKASARPGGTHRDGDDQPGRRQPPAHAGHELTREYKGQTFLVRVLPHGFEFEGEVYKSLSAVAKAITGTHCNGYLFFRLDRQGGAK